MPLFFCRSAMLRWRLLNILSECERQVAWCGRVRQRNGEGDEEGMLVKKNVACSLLLDNKIVTAATLDTPPSTKSCTCAYMGIALHSPACRNPSRTPFRMGT